MAGMAAVQPPGQSQADALNADMESDDEGIDTMNQRGPGTRHSGRRPHRGAIPRRLKRDRLDSGIKRGLEYQYMTPHLPRPGAGTIPQEVDTKKGECDRNYAKCWTVCMRYSNYMIRDKKRDCKIDCFAKKRHCYFAARPAHLQIKPEFREMMGLAGETQTFDEWVDSLHSTRPNWKSTYDGPGLTGQSKNA